MLTFLAPAHPRKKTFKESYSLSKDLGSGAFSVVKLATHKVEHTLHRIVVWGCYFNVHQLLYPKVSGTNTAVKIITKRKLTDEDLAALMTEISILREMDHPHIIKYVCLNHLPYVIYTAKSLLRVLYDRFRDSAIDTMMNGCDVVEV